MEGSLPSTSTSGCPALDILEKKLYLNNSFTPVAEVKSKLIEFSNFWNSGGRISLLNASKEDSEELVYLLLTLKKNIKYTLSEVGKCRIKRDTDIVCTECNGNIHIPHDEQFWDCLQEHEHVEETFLKYLDGSISLENSIHNRSESVPTLSSTSSELDQNNVENGDSGIEHCEPPANGDECSKYSSEDEGINTFRFNFKLSYDKFVESKLYPESIMRSVCKMDQIENFTIQKLGPSRAVCLICYCDIISRGRVHKMVIMDHVAGQRHLRNSRSFPNLIALQKYHELFLNLDPEYQAHQVYFSMVDLDSLSCCLCCQKIPASRIVDHIMSQSHKKVVLSMFKNNNYAFYLVNMQVKLYGITEEQVVEQKLNEIIAPKVEEQTSKEKKKKSKEKQDSESRLSPGEIKE